MKVIKISREKKCNHDEFFMTTKKGLCELSTYFDSQHEYIIYTSFSQIVYKKSYKLSPRGKGDKNKKNILLPVLGTLTDEI
jgi:hypothetical protein